MVKHVLKNGSVLDDISGVVIKAEDFPRVYEILEKYGDGYEKDKSLSNS